MRGIGEAAQCGAVEVVRSEPLLIAKLEKAKVGLPLVLRVTLMIQLPEDVSAPKVWTERRYC